MMSKSLPVQIIEALRDEDDEAIRRLFSQHPDQLTAHTPIGGQTWLGYAAQLGKLNVAKALVGLGIDVNLGDSRYGSAPICSAADSGHYQVVEYLLSAGASLSVDASVRNPLFAAIIGRSPRIVQLLLEAGIDAKARYTSKTMKDMDALAFALLRGELECAEVIASWIAEGDEAEASARLKEADLVAEANVRGSRKSGTRAPKK